MRVLVLGGTGEARALADRLVAAGADVTTSLAGRVGDPARPAGRVRVGGFAGAAGLAAYLLEHAPDAVVDATHPFAATMTEHAVRACAGAGVALVVLRRPGWTAGPGDRWTRVPSLTAAAALVRESPAGTVFVTTGRRDLAAFAADGGHAYLVRTIEAPDGPLPPRTTVLLDRGPYSEADELALLRAHGVRLLVTKDSGADATRAKLDAARRLDVPVVVVDRPPLPHGVRPVGTVDEVLAALSA